MAHGDKSQGVALSQSKIYDDISPLWMQLHAEGHFWLFCYIFFTEARKSVVGPQNAVLIIYK